MQGCFSSGAIYRLFAIAVLVVIQCSDCCFAIADTQSVVEQNDSALSYDDMRGRSIRAGDVVIDCAKKSTVFVFRSTNSVAVYNLDSEATSDVVLSVGNLRIPIEVGREVVVCTDPFADFQKANPTLGVSFRNQRLRETNPRFCVFSAEFSIATALKNIASLKQLGDSKDPNEQRLFKRILKNAAILTSSTVTRRKYVANSSILHGEVREDSVGAGVFSIVAERVVDLSSDFTEQYVEESSSIPLGVFRKKWFDLRSSPRLKKAPAMFAFCHKNTLFKTDHGLILGKRGASLLINTDRQSTSLFVLGAEGVRDVEMLVSGKILKLRPGEHAISTFDTSKTYDELVKDFGIGFRNPLVCSLGERKIYKADFSISSLACQVPPLRRVLSSSDPADRRVAHSILKSAAVLHGLTMADGVYKFAD